MIAASYPKFYPNGGKYIFQPFLTKKNDCDAVINPP
jgi:hypothetical protein